MVKPRQYQIKALDKIYEDLKKYPDVLLQGMMGCGKTFIAVTLIKRLYYENPGMKFLILMHKQELVDQFYQAFQKFTDIPFRKIGICCASLNQKVVDRDITIASIQTFVNIKESYMGAGLIVVDEAHRIDINGNTQYKQVFDYLRLQRPKSRLFGITATPARLGHGYIYGSKCKPGAFNLFQHVSYKIAYDDLREEGFLVPLKGVVANHESMEQDLSGVSTSGDYVLNQLGEIMTQERHIKTAIEAIENYCGDYKRICVFCCTIDHAEQLAGMIDGATTVHSQLSSVDRQNNMMSWENGEKRIMTSVMILTEGFDMPELDCLVFARPTLSSTLWLQAVGRVLRIHPGKDHGFLVDLTCNTSRFGTDLDNVKITVPKSVEKVEEKERSLIKICPNCEIEVHVATRICDCGFEWPPPEVVEADMPDMKNVVFIKSPPREFDIIDWAIEEHESKKNGKLLGKITFLYSHTEYKEDKVYMWLCFEDHYQGFAVQKAKEKWSQVSECNFPKSVDEFMNSHFKDLKTITVDLSGKYPELISVGSEVLEYEDEVPF